jgi:hypothetical protein
MWKTFVFLINFLLFLNCVLVKVNSQDTIPIPLKIKIGLEVSGPVIYYTNKNILSEEAFISVDLDEKRSVILAAGYLDYKYSQFNYTFLNKGTFIRLGMDFNLLKPDKSQGKYWAGIGLRYGLSRFTYQVPTYQKTDYWGTTISSISPKVNWGHFVEFTPGVRTELFNHLSIGWSVSLRMLLYTGTSKNLRPVNFPGFGDGSKTITTGMNYFIIWNIPYKKIKVILKKEVKEEPEDNSNTNNKGTNNTNSTRQQGSGIRQ